MTEPESNARNLRWLMAGLFLVTTVTLVLEVLDARLLSALTWYHLAFFAISLAMLGMASGAVLVFLGGSKFEGERGAKSLPRYCLWLAVSIPVSHIVNLRIPIPTLDAFSAMGFVALTITTIALATPFLLSGVVVTIALTRTKGPIGKLYAADLFGAAFGCLLVVGLLETMDISSIAFVAGGIGAMAAYCFHRFAGTRGIVSTVLLATLLLGAGAVNASLDQGIGVIYSKGRKLTDELTLAWSAWNTHSWVFVTAPEEGAAYYWGPGVGARDFRTTSAWMLIDGEAGTGITRWGGDPESLDWVSYDLTALPYHIRTGAVGIIGVGGGRDVLSALWGANSPITGIEINDNLLAALNGPYRDFANISTHPDVELVHGEARSYLSRTDKRFDVLQMSLIDTWAATGAGAFTLSENGLYTLEAWGLFLSTLKPGGVFSVSRWFAPSATSETSRLLALATAALLERGVHAPADQLVLATRGNLATLMVSEGPFSSADQTRIQEQATARGFTVLVAPWLASDDGDAWLSRVARSRSRAELDIAIEDPTFDFSPPTDERPFFFNTLKPSSFYRADSVPRDGVVFGNLRATWTLVTLFLVCTVLVGAIIIVPLVWTGLPDMSAGTFAFSLAYFAIIGTGFMLIQIPFLQRFSVYLGHPTYTLVVILFAMILFAGMGSYLSHRLPLATNLWQLNLPLAIGAAVLATTFVLQRLTEGTIHFGLPARSAIVVACVAPIAVLLGFCFPIGMSLVGRISSDATAWMWGVNGACSVLASIAAVAISMWMGISTNLILAGLLYTLLAIPARVLARRAGLVRL